MKLSKGWSSNWLLIIVFISWAVWHLINNVQHIRQEINDNNNFLHVAINWGRYQISAIFKVGLVYAISVIENGWISINSILKIIYLGQTDLGSDDV